LEFAKNDPRHQQQATAEATAAASSTFNGTHEKR